MFLLGHSHVVVLEDAATAMKAPYKSLNLWGFGRPVLYDEKSPRLNPALSVMLDDFVVSTVGGSAHDMVGLAQHPRRFDLVLPERPDLPLDDRAEILPAGAVKSAIRANMEDEQLDLIRLLARPGRRVVHVESPPPSPPGPRLDAEIGQMPYAAQSQLGSSSAWLRFKLWRLHSEIVRSACEEVGIEFLAHPKAALVDHCYLNPKFYERPCHANAGFGALVMQQLGVGS